MTTLLGHIQAAGGELGLFSSYPTFAVGSSDANMVQLLALAKREGAEFAAMANALGGWPQLRKEYTFNLVAVGPYTATVTPGSNVLTNLSSVAGIVVGYVVSGPGVQQSTTVTAVGTNTVTMSMAATASTTLSQQSFTFGQEAYSFPSDLAYFMPQTQWDRNFRWQLLGPLDAQEWQVLKSGISPAGPRIRFRIMAGKMYINPIQSATQTDLIAYEYMSNAWCQSATGTAQTTWQADTDTYLLDPDCMTMGIKWRFLRAKGLDYGQEKRDYEMAVQRAKSRAGLSRTLPLGARSGYGSPLIGPANVPDTGFGS